ncbi:hypothetical protein ACHAXS_007932 [Conticribra weissflogii]
MTNWNDKIFLFESKEYQSARPRIPLVSDSSHLKCAKHRSNHEVGGSDYCNLEIWRSFETTSSTK